MRSWLTIGRKVNLQQRSKHRSIPLRFRQTCTHRLRCSTGSDSGWNPRASVILGLAAGC